MDGVPTKTCVSCGRTITWRRKWERTWDDVRYCSDACRRRGVTADDRRVQDALAARVRAGSPGDVATAAELGVPVETVRRAGRRLAAAGEAEFVQRGRVVDPSTARGPVTFRRRR